VARAIVLRQLTSSPKSRLQLARKLAERNVPEDVAEAVLDRFEEVRLVDDAEFADMWVRSRSQTRKLAKGALRRELADKGIDADIAAQALEQLSDEAEESAARELVQRKLKGTADLTDRSERDKVTRRLASMLARKGYQPSQAFRIVGEVLDAATGLSALLEELGREAEALQVLKRGVRIQHKLDLAAGDAPPRSVARQPASST
jgi:regulatory protein